MPAPISTPRPVKPSYAPPRTEAEKTLARIWEDVLQLHPIGIDDNFLELGGHSLAATQVISQIIPAFDIELPLKALFNAPTIAQMAAIIAEHQAQPATTDALARLLDEVEALDDNQASQLLTSDKDD